MNFFSVEQREHCFLPAVLRLTWLVCQSRWGDLGGRPLVSMGTTRSEAPSKPAHLRPLAFLSPENHRLFCSWMLLSWTFTVVLMFPSALIMDNWSSGPHSRDWSTLNCRRGKQMWANVINMNSVFIFITVPAWHKRTLSVFHLVANQSHWCPGTRMEIRSY